MKLFLIRHGETVDNIAQIYAGVTDSALTNHGVQQASRLGSYFAKSGLTVTTIFSSDLQRAFKTADAIRRAQAERDGVSTLQVEQLGILRERDFGSREKTSFSSRPKVTSKSRKDEGKGAHARKESPMEDRQSMIYRMNKFLNDILVPLITKEGVKEPTEEVVAIVSHGIILSVLWKCLLWRFDLHTVRAAPGILEKSNGSCEDITAYGGWANTGYMELEINPQKLPRVHLSEGPKLVTAQKPAHWTCGAVGMLPCWCMTIRRRNMQEHLEGLKRQLGGVGSSKHDPGQLKLENFFKKRRVVYHEPMMKHISQQRPVLKPHVDIEYVPTAV